ncbi:ABC transporter substrate-binding protein [Pseudomonas sp. Marseille-Q5117]|uniref:ABC transporter substrate-binding protein n=1 Tax=Pseudomonas sp. Marseille-Q5117 TaxID=2972777 RepID=UPI0021C75339|nr:ABC transporter substrate-binding protein [Pseudomonas sp. Marseille-Q5117]
MKTHLSTTWLHSLPLLGLLYGCQVLAAEPTLCGPPGSAPASGTPILVGAIVGKTGPDDFSSAAAAARAYFKCVNENGGIGGRPIEYAIEDDKWNPETAAQAASKLVKDRKVVALVGSGSFIEMSVNAKLYEQEKVISMASGCAVRECFEARNIATTNQGPLPSNLGAVQWSVRKQGSKRVACIGLNIPSNGVWSCDAVNDWLKQQGLEGVSVVFDPAAADFTGVILEAMAANPDTILLNLPAGAGLGVLKAAQEQDLRDQYKWIAATPLYDNKIPAALGDYWDGHLAVQIELTRLDGQGPDAKRWRALMAKYGVGDSRASNRIDTFSQAGFVSANIFVETLRKMDPNQIDRASVSEALRGVKDYRTDLLCAPWTFGTGDKHMANHAGMMVQVKDLGYSDLEGCFEVEIPAIYRQDESGQGA